MRSVKRVLVFMGAPCIPFERTHPTGDDVRLHVARCDLKHAEARPAGMHSSCAAQYNRVVTECCSPSGYRWAFSERRARHEARRYELRGLDATSLRIVELLKREGVEGLTLLEVGGGIGAVARVGRYLVQVRRNRWKT